MQAGKVLFLSQTEASHFSPQNFLFWSQLWVLSDKDLPRAFFLYAPWKGQRAQVPSPARDRGSFSPTIPFAPCALPCQEEVLRFLSVYELTPPLLENQLG